MPTFLGRNIPPAFVRKTQPFSERSLIPIVSPEALLSSRQREKIISEIKTIVDAPDEHYAVLYDQLIKNFAEFVQVLPTNNEAKLGSLLIEGLLRSLFVLQIQKQSSAEKTDPITTYVLFSAALLFDVGFSTYNRTVAISNKQGEFVKQWWPHKGAMQIEDGYYKIRRGGGFPPWLARRATVLFAKHLMPPLGYHWIARDVNAFNTWISLLNNEREGIEDLKLYFDRAIEQLEKHKTEPGFVVPVELDVTEPNEVSLAEDFLEWLENGLEDGSININNKDSNVHMTPDGLLIDIPGIFQEFSKWSPQHPLWSLALEKFKQLGLVNLFENAAMFTKYYYMQPDRALLRNPAFVDSLGDQIARTGIKQGMLISIACCAVMFRSRYYPAVDRYIRFVDNQNLKQAKAAQKSQYPKLDELFQNLKEVFLSDMRSTTTRK